jgi:hypothetical protein
MRDKISRLADIIKLKEFIRTNFAKQAKENIKNLSSEEKIMYTTFIVSFSLDEIYDKTLSLYEKHLSEKEVEGLIDFYESEVGKSILIKMPVILTEATKFSEKFFTEKLSEFLKNSGIEKFNTKI